YHKFNYNYESFSHVACTVNLAKMVLIFPPMFWSSLVPIKTIWCKMICILYKLSL
ncbi:hypothetical protein L9F63_018376, partial [Diploptera punctata]